MSCAKFLLASVLLASSLWARVLPFVVVIPSYNNEKYCVRNLSSVFSQDYHNYRVIYIDDCSSDATYVTAQETIKAHQQEDRVKLIHNEKRCLAMENLYNAIHSCEDREIVVILDGDDWFPHPQVLKKLDRIYSDPSVWMTYGNFITYPGGKKGISTGVVPSFVLKQNKLRNYAKKAWPFSHLKTCYASLFKKIKREDLMWEGQFLPSAYDVAMMVPMAEMAAFHARFVDETLYVYNYNNPISDVNVDNRLQANCREYILTLPHYEPLEKLFE